ncbi:PLP-dependent aminotransferase family protein [Conexibacter stalactiti]|uniref:PLP-dependent aminotransferase family protein n=1 Tax=Conexibacter stalactiti TaxID=1940611 RepID=A0ABU4HY13_9ACTN|nr:PLP-dependent aminotransferase family protein [Conexibacter stalactiti]MDW5598166.1 PLP-dependent aminotransferase family protein [Conexibacter stalactiti]MEC5038808.1 PLP-dependent aminotransferase family protein [Conexibacter stalactiti]
MDLLLDLDTAPGTTLRRRAEHALREAVRSGRLAPGTRLPSTRALAVELGVSRGVVVEAYAQLAAEGYLRTHRGGGTTVAGTGAPVQDRGSAVADRGAAGANSGAPDADRGAPDALGGTDWAGEAVAAGEAAVPMRHDLRPALPALAGFPRAAWLASLSRVLRALPDERLGYPDPAGVPELRETLAAYLGRVRGVRAAPHQIVVTGGLRDALTLLWSTLAAQGATRIAVERPGWRGWSQTAAAAGLTSVPLAVDRDGAVVESLASGAAGEVGARGAVVDAVAVTPAHQFPTGAVLSPQRRGALVAWAQRSGGLIVEDDYDAEFRYDRKPIGSLQGLAPDVVVYGGSASKTLAPAVRLGWLVLPPALVEPVAAEQRRRGGTPAPLDQLAFADIVARGELDRHLRRQRRRYRRQRDALLAALARELPQIEVDGAAAGLHAVLRLPPQLDERAVREAARARGVAVEAIGHGPPALVVGYANVTEPAVPAAVAALAEAVRAVERGQSERPATSRGLDGVR